VITLTDRGVISNERGFKLLATSPRCVDPFAERPARHKLIGFIILNDEPEPAPGEYIISGRIISMIQSPSRAITA